MSRTERAARFERDFYENPDAFHRAGLKPLIDPRAEQQNARTESDLIALARKRGYRNPEWWARKIIAGRKGKK